MKNASLFVVALLGFAAPAFAQAPFPGAVQIDGGWVPCTHPLAIQRGVGCTSEPSAPLTSQVSTTAAAAPAPWDAAPNDPLQPGHFYRHPYTDVMFCSAIGYSAMLQAPAVYCENLVGPSQRGTVWQFPLDMGRGSWWEIDKGAVNDTLRFWNLPEVK
ncbi:MAG: hypothetical protein U0Q12_20780 [Vicinamibacterales bacterium]